MTSTNCLFCPTDSRKSKDNSFTAINVKGKQQIHTFKELEPANERHFAWTMTIMINQILEYLATILLWLTSRLIVAATQDSVPAANASTQILTVNLAAKPFRQKGNRKTQEFWMKIILIPATKKKCPYTNKKNCKKWTSEAHLHKTGNIGSAGVDWLWTPWLRDALTGQSTREGKRTDHCTNSSIAVSGSKRVARGNSSCHNK